MPVRRTREGRKGKASRLSFLHHTSRAFPRPQGAMATSFAPTQAELAIVNALFASADPNKLGIITGDAAVKTFAGANLQPTVLGEIWAIADSDNNGFLTRKGVAVAIRLIGYAQKGQAIKESLLDSRVSFRNILIASSLTDPVSSGPARSHRRHLPLCTFSCPQPTSYPFPKDPATTSATNARRQDQVPQAFLRLRPSEWFAVRRVRTFAPPFKNTKPTLLFLFQAIKPEMFSLNRSCPTINCRKYGVFHQRHSASKH